MSSARKETSDTTGACKGCGAHLDYTPGTSQVKCEYCGVQNEIAVKWAGVNQAASSIESSSKGNKIIFSPVKTREWDRSLSNGQVKKPRNGCFAIFLYLIVIPLAVLFFFFIFMIIYKAKG
ncbi:zinc finger domain-containing protein [Pedobacter sp. AW31-3R]|uniref:zinc finger domain-containing protein n=1 Tax=Pedobacter sp. AW31-3R TaxID=3445781 RepID=UPI003FA038E8